MTSSHPARLAHLGIGDLLDILPDAVVMVDANSRIVYVNPAVRELLGHSPSELLGESLQLLLPPAARESHAVKVTRYRNDGEPRLMGVRPVLHAQHRTGRLVPVSISLCNQTMPDGERVSVAVIHDIAAMKTPLDRATALAETDRLTGLGNHLRLTRRTQALLAHGRPFALLSIALDGFGELAERLGPKATEELLRRMAERLQRQVLDGDVVVHLDDGAFVMMIDGITDAQALMQRAEAMHPQLQAPMPAGELVIEPALHFGAALGPRHGLSVDDLLDAADQAMANARGAGLCCVLAHLKD